MRYLQRQLLNKRQVVDYGIAVGIGGDVVINSTNNVLLPKGTTVERPIIPTDGMIRYNTTTSEVEVRQGSVWRSLRFKESTGITLQSLGFGDGSTTLFVSWKLSGNFCKKSSIPGSALSNFPFSLSEINSLLVSKATILFP